MAEIPKHSRRRDENQIAPELVTRITAEPDKYSEEDRREDQALVQSETEAMHTVLQADAANITRKYILIRIAAKKLYQKHRYRDPSIISARLKRLFRPNNTKDPRVSHATIERALDYQDGDVDYNRFKRDYEKKPIEPKTDFQILMIKLVEINASLRDIAQDLQHKARKEKTNTDLQQELLDVLEDLHKNTQTYTSEFLAQFRNLQNLENLKKFLDVLIMDAHALGDLTDDRKLLQPFMKLNLKTLMVSNSLSSLAKRFDMSPKWMAMINSDNFLMELVQKLRACPHCGVDLVHHTNMVKDAYVRGLPTPEPLRFSYHTKQEIKYFDARVLSAVAAGRIPAKINKCAYAACTVEPKRVWKNGDVVAEQYHTDERTGNKMRSIYHPECLKKKKEHEYDLVIASTDDD